MVTIRSLLWAVVASRAFAAPSGLEKRTCVHDATLNLFLAFGVLAKDFCELYEQAPERDLPVFAAPWVAETSKIKSACSCIVTSTTSSSKSSTSYVHTTRTSTLPTTTSTSSFKSSTTSSRSTQSTTSSRSTQSTTSSRSTQSTKSSSSTLSSTSSSSTLSTTSSNSIPSTTTSSSTLSTTSSSSSLSTTTFSSILSTTTSSSTLSTTSSTTLSTTTSSPTLSSTTSSSTLSTTTSSSISSSITSSSTMSSTISSSTLSTTTSTSTLSTTISSSSIASTSTATPCTCTAFSQIAPAVAACTTITLQDIHAPTNSTIDLTKVKTGTTITFAGTTTFDFTNSSTFNPISLGGKNITVKGAPESIIDGNGQAYWDGQGSNGGVPKPDHFFVVSKLTQHSVIEDLYIQNWPTHCFSISGCADMVIQRITLNNSAGDAPNAISGGLPAAHNSDGFDISTTNNTLLTDSTVINQDDCVAITSGNNITTSNFYCSGGHGMSIGSVGGKSNNNVTNILFTDSIITNSQNGPRIKSNFNTTGFISNITYSNIAVSEISIYGIDVQQDYLNGGPTGIPSNGVILENILFQNVTGTATNSAQDYYVLCGDGSCINIEFVDTDIEGGGVVSSCNEPDTGCPGP